MEKNQVKRVHAGGGDRQKVREREEAREGEREVRVKRIN